MKINCLCGVTFRLKPNPGQLECNCPYCKQAWIISKENRVQKPLKVRTKDPYIIHKFLFGSLVFTMFFCISMVMQEVIK